MKSAKMKHKQNQSLMYLIIPRNELKNENENFFSGILENCNTGQFADSKDRNKEEYKKKKTKQKTKKE